MTDADKQRKEWSMDEIRHANTIRGPESPEQAAFYVEQGVLSPDDAAFLLENRRRTDAYLDHNFEQRLRRTLDAYLAMKERHRGGQVRIEDNESIRNLYSLFLDLRRREPRLAMEFCAARIGVKYGTLKRWHQRFKGKLPEKKSAK